MLVIPGGQVLLGFPGDWSTDGVNIRQEVGKLCASTASASLLASISLLFPDLRLQV